MKTIEKLAAPECSSLHTTILCVGALQMDLVNRKVFVEGRPVKLTAKEFELLGVLMERKGEVVNQDLFLSKTKRSRGPFQDQRRTIAVYILRLRKKLGSQGCRIITMRNVGYRLDVSLEWIKFGS